VLSILAICSVGQSSNRCRVLTGTDAPPHSMELASVRGGWRDTCRAADGHRDREEMNRASDVASGTWSTPGNVARAGVSRLLPKTS
jgi:hypothetical protein